MELYWGSGSPYAWRVMLALMVKHLDYEGHLLSFAEREHKQPAYLALNPRGKVPTLVDGDVVVTESLAIMAYLDRVHPRPGLFGRTAPESGPIWAALLEIEHYVMPRMQAITRALLSDRVDRAPSEYKEQVAALHRELDRLNSTAIEGPLNAVDCTLLPVLALLERVSLKKGADTIALAPFDRERWAALEARCTLLREHDGYEQTRPPHW